MIDSNHFPIIKIGDKKYPSIAEDTEAANAVLHLSFLTNGKLTVRAYENMEKKSGVPLYLQIYEQLLQKIEDRIWPVDTMIPTEAELCKEYDVSNITVREAIRILVQDGKLSRTPGKGTFVTRQKLEQKLNRFFSFTRWARQNGLKPASRILRVETMDCDSHIDRKSVV